MWLGISQHSRQLPCVEPPCALRFWKVTFFAQRESQVSVLKTRTKKSTHSCFLPVLLGLWAAPGPWPLLPSPAPGSSQEVPEHGQSNASPAARKPG